MAWWDKGMGGNGKPLGALGPRLPFSVSRFDVEPEFPPWSIISLAHRPAEGCRRLLSLHAKAAHDPHWPEGRRWPGPPAVSGRVHATRHQHGATHDERSLRNQWHVATGDRTDRGDTDPACSALLNYVVALYLILLGISGLWPHFAALNIAPGAVTRRLRSLHPPPRSCMVSADGSASRALAHWGTYDATSRIARRGRGDRP